MCGLAVALAAWSPAVAADPEPADFCAEYPGVSALLTELYGQYMDSDPDADPDLPYIHSQLVAVNNVLAYLMTDPDIPDELYSNMAYVQPYFAELQEAMRDRYPDKPGQQMDYNKVSQLMTDEKRADISDKVMAMRSVGASYCGLDSEPTASDEPTASATPSHSAQPSATAQPSVSLSPTTAPSLAQDKVTIIQSGAKFTFVASGFQAGEQVTATVDATIAVGQKVAPASGVVSFEWTAKTAGQHSVTIAGPVSGNVTKTFTASALPATGDAWSATVVSLAALAALALAALCGLAAAAASTAGTRRL
ncbi:MAG: hypothetical protein LBK42_07955 [Propionibacteriaceae bacterium]|nr:hypothetical protein [Propionibacteriaceae bacterium]